MIITPAEFQSEGLAWVSAITLVTLGVVAAVGKVLGEVRVLRAQSLSHADDIRSINEQITSVATQVAPVASTVAAAPPSSVAAVVVEQSPVDTGEQHADRP